MSGPSRGTSRPLVLALGMNTHASAALLAEIRHGTSQICENAAQAIPLIASARQPVVVIMDAAAWTPEDILTLNRAAAKNPALIELGFILADGEHQLMLAVRRLARTGVPGKSTGPQLLADAMKSRLPGRKLIDLAEMATAEQPMAAWLSQAAELLFIVGHGNGLDIGLGPLSLCRRHSFETSDASRLFPCFQGASCCRPGQQHMEADTVKARRIIAATCWGIYPPGGNFHPEASAGFGLLAGGWVEAILTSVRVTIFRAPDLALMYYFVNSGISFGRVAILINRYRLAAGLEADLACFGDATSTIEASVVNVQASWHGRSCRLHLDLSDAGDFCLAVPSTSACLGRYIIIDGEDAASVSCVYDLHETIFLTTKPSEIRRDSALELTVVPTLLLSDEEHLRMKRAMAALAPLLDGGRAALGPDHAELNDTRDKWKAVTELLTNWPLADLAPGTGVSRTTLHRTLSTLQHGFSALAQAWIQLFQCLVPTVGIYHARGFWLGQAVFQSEKRRVRRCSYCKGIIDEATFALSDLSHSLRSLSHCQLCGPVCDGNAEIAASLEGPEAIEAGLTLSFTVAVANPYDCPLPVAAALMVERFDRKHSLVGERAAGMLEAGENASLMLSVAIPCDWPAGICYVGVAVSLAGEVTYLRRGIAVKPRHPGTAVVAIHRPAANFQNS